VDASRKLGGGKLISIPSIAYGHIQLILEFECEIENKIVDAINKQEER